MTDTDLERRLRDLRHADLPSGVTGRPIDTARAWRDFQALRSRSAAIRHRAMMAAAIVVVAAAAITIPALAGRGPGGPPRSLARAAACPHQPGPIPARSRPGTS